MLLEPKTGRNAKMVILMSSWRRRGKEGRKARGNAGGKEDGKEGRKKTERNKIIKKNRKGEKERKEMKKDGPFCFGRIRVLGILGLPCGIEFLILNV